VDVTFDLLQENDILEGFTDYHPDRIKSFISEKQNIALVAKLGGDVIGLI